MSLTKGHHIEKKFIHPHKFAMWLAIGSMSMMFAGLTSAYLVNKSKGNWVYFNVPTMFWYSTFVILISSFTLIMAKKAIATQNLSRYKNLLITTLILGLVFIVLQYFGFKELFANGIKVSGNPSESFFYIIPGLHAIHVFGGVVALVILVIRNYFNRTNKYNPLPVEIAGNYWHFVDILWIYLFIFFLLTQQLKL